MKPLGCVRWLAAWPIESDDCTHINSCKAQNRLVYMFCMIHLFDQRTHRRILCEVIVNGAYKPIGYQCSTHVFMCQDWNKYIIVYMSLISRFCLYSFYRFIQNEEMGDRFPGVGFDPRLLHWWSPMVVMMSSASNNTGVYERAFNCWCFCANIHSLSTAPAKR